MCHCVDQPMLIMFIALFFIRDDSFTDSIADETVRKQFIDELQPIASKKLKVLKEEIGKRFPVDILVVQVSATYVTLTKINFVDVIYHIGEI